MIRFSLIVIVLLSASALYAQPAQWEHYSDSNTPECLIQDGPYLWVGTDGGLVKFDKNVDTFFIYNPENSGLPINSILSLTRGKDGSIWVGTRGGGLASYMHGSWSTYTTTNSQLPSNWVPAIAADSIGRIWIGTNGGLVKIDNGVWTIYTTANTQFVANSIYALATDRQSNVWIATNNQTQIAGKYSLLKFDGASIWEFHDAATDAGFDNTTNVSTMLVAKNGDLWLGMEGYLDHIHNRTWDSRDAVPEYNGPVYNYVRGLAEDATGGIWISDGYGTARFDGSTWTEVHKIEDLTFPYMRSDGVVVDGSDVWFISSNMDQKYGNGIALLRNGKWSRFDSLSNCSLTENWLTAMTVDSKGRYWFGERNLNRVNMFDGTTWTHFDTITRGTYTMSLCADSSGNVYIGTGGNGVVKFDGVTPQYYDLVTLLNHSNVVSALAYDKRGVLWIGTQWQGSSGRESGLVRYDGTSWSHYPYSDSTLPEGEVSSLAVDPQGGVWAATWYAGIAHFDRAGKWTVYHSSNSAIPGDQVFKVDQAQNGDIWIATLTGAAKWDGTAWTSFTTANSGIIGNLATCGIDTHGDVWFGAFDANGAGGATVFDGQAWKTFTPANSPIGSNLMENIMGGSNGDVWFETYDIGIVRYNPQGINPPCLNRLARLSIFDSTQPASSNGIVHSVVAITDSVPRVLGLHEIALTVHYDERMFSRRNVTAINGWQIDRIQDIPGGVSITLRSMPHDISRGEAVVAVDLQPFVGQVSSSTVQLRDTRFNPSDPKFENCTLASIAVDSLIVTFANACGDSLIRAGFDRTPLLQLLSVNPDPVSSGDWVSLGIEAARPLELSIAIADLTGATVHSETRAMPHGTSTIRLDLRALPSGVYSVTIASEGTVVRRKVVKL